MRDAGGDVLLFAAAHTRLRFGHGLGARILMLTSWRGRGPRRLLGDFLLAGDRPCRALAGPRVGLGALAAHRQALAVTQTAVAAEVHEALDVHRHVAAQVALDHELAVDGLADARHTIGRAHVCT